MLQPGFGAGFARRVDLLIRVHVLRRVHRAGRRRVPELRRRIRPAAGAAARGIAAISRKPRADIQTAGLRFLE